MTSIGIFGVGSVCGAGVGHAALLSGWQRESAKLATNTESLPSFRGARQFIQADEFDAAACLGKKGLQFLTRGTHLLLAAAIEAMKAAEVDGESVDLGVVIGTNFAGLASIANYDWTVISEGPSFVTVMDTPNVLANAPASHLAIRVKARSLNTTVSTGRCASLDAIGYAAHFLQQGRVEAVVAGGVEEANSHVLWQSAAAVQSGRESAIPGEGAAAVILRRGEEREGSAAPALAVFGAWANMLAPAAPPEQSIEEVCRQALDVAAVRVQDIALIALGIGSAGDAPLTEGVKRLLVSRGQAGSPVPSFSLKGLVGETMGAAGALHVAAVVEAFACREAPATVGLAELCWPGEFKVASQPAAFDPGPALIVEWDPAGFASALVLTPASSGGRA